MQEMLRSAGHDVVGVTVGSSHRVIPDYFHAAFPVPVTPLPSPSFRFNHCRGV